MSGKEILVDTNILLYAISTVRAEQPKARIALEILDAEDIAISVQILEEFYVQATRPSKREHLSHEQAVAFIESWLRFHVQEVSIALMQSALSTKFRWNISFWDAAIVEAARMSGCNTILSEDLQNGMDFAGIRVENPFV